MSSLLARLLVLVGRVSLTLGLRGVDREYLRGDLEESRARRRESAGEVRAAAWFLGQALRSVAERRIVPRRRRLGDRSWSLTSGLGSLGQDVRFAVRVLAKQPGFTLGAVAMLALGVGATTAMFTFVDGLVLRPLPYADATHLVELREVAADGGTYRADYHDYLDWRERAHGFADMAAFYDVSLNASLDDVPSRVSGIVADDNLLDLLGVEPALGRGFLPGESGPGSARVVVIADSLWRRAFAADPRVIGREMRLQGRSYTVVGVMPPGFHFREYAELWIPHRFDPAESRRGSYYWHVLARLAPGVELGGARSEMRALAETIAREHPDTNAGRSATATPLREAIVGDSSTHALTFLGFVVLVQMIATLNVGNLLLARAVGRRREMAVRAAIGAGRARLLRQLVTESLVLAGAGGIAGIFVGLRGRTMILDAVPADIPLWFDFSFDWRVALFSIGVTMLTGLAFGLLPAYQASRDVNAGLKEGGDWDGTAAPRLRSWLVSAEVAMALVLLVGAGLMLRGAARTRAVDPGLDPHHVLTFTMSLPSAEYGPAERVTFYEGLIDRLASLPGAERAAAISLLPLSNSANLTPVRVEGLELSPGERPRNAVLSVVAGDYFDVMRVAMRRGRGLASGAGDDDRPVAVVSESLARRYWPEGDAPGHRIRIGSDPDSPWLTIVGVAAGVRHFGLDSDPVDAVYVPLRRDAQTRMTLVVRTSDDPRNLAGDARELVRRIEPDVPVYALRTMEKVMDDSMWQSRVYSWMFGVFAGIALSLAAVGLYGLVAYAVGRQTREIGIRMALGAAPSRVLAMIVRQAIGRVLVGIALGMVGATLLSRLLSSMVFGMRLADPGVYLAVGASLLLVALGATLLPGRRAAHIDPLVALRSE